MSGSVFRIAETLLKLDIDDLNYNYDERIGLLYARPSVRPGVLVRIGSFFWHFVEGLRGWRAFWDSAVPMGAILLFMCTVNQKNALKPVAERLRGACSVGCGDGLDGCFPVFWAHLAAIPFAPLALWRWTRARGYRRKTWRYNVDQYWLTYGYYITARVWLQHLRPSALVVANDHVMPHRVLVRAARELAIPTIYLQHASVTEAFPPLGTDYAFLEGIDSLRKYDQAGASHTTVLLVGMPKMDPYVQHANHCCAARSVAICTNRLDPIPRVQALCEHIRNNFPGLNVTIRPHPADTRRGECERIAGIYRASFSDSRVESSFELLKRVDVLIAGDSSILLEAALMNVFPIQYDFAMKAADYYGFVRNGLADYACEPQQVVEQLSSLWSSRPDVQMRAAKYVASVGTRYAGRCGELAAALVQTIASGSQIDLQQWSPIPCTNLRAFELADRSGAIMAPPPREWPPRQCMR